MNGPGGPEIDVERLMRDITTVVEHTRSQASAISAGNAGPDRVPDAQDIASVPTAAPIPLPTIIRVQIKPAFARSADGVHELPQLLSFDGDAFVTAAYICVMQREPDPLGREYFLNLLRAGTSKVEVLGQLRYSPEGIAVGARIRGLRGRSSWDRLRGAPIVGRLLRVASALWSLPASMRERRAFECRMVDLLEQLERASATNVASLAHAIQEVDARLAARNQRMGALGHRIAQLRDHARESTTALGGEIALIRSLTEEHQRSSADAIVAVTKRVDGVDVRARLSELEQAMVLGLAAKINRYEVVDLIKHFDLPRRALPGDPGPEPAPEYDGSHVTASVAGGRGQALAGEELHRLDAMYAAFEDQFRGTRSDIRNAQSFYLPYLRNALAGSPQAPIVDLGCGRGEWLELLRDESFTARGVDLNRVFLQGCRERSLAVTEQDVVGYLRGLESESVGAITAFHLVEHVPLLQLIALFDEARRVLKKGGIVIFETPNPENIQVGACNFYVDPTHLKPLPPPLLVALLELRGFAAPTILRRDQDARRALAPTPLPDTAPNASSINALIELIRDNFYVSPDYAVIAHRT
jgi:SAM-dependent methyltransferase